MARSVPDPGQQARALAAIAGSLTSAGQYSQAEAVARSISSPYQKARMLAVLATTLASAGETLAARRLAATALAAGAWHNAAVPALALDPFAWTRVATSR